MNAALDLETGRPCALYECAWTEPAQTIMFGDAFGSDTILADANAFSLLKGLPRLATSGASPNLT